MHVHPLPRVLSSSLLPFIKGQIQREQQMSKRWPLWWQRLGLELKDMPNHPPPSLLHTSTPHSRTHPSKQQQPHVHLHVCTHTHTLKGRALLDRLTLERILERATWSVSHLMILQPPQLPPIHPELWKSSKCVAFGGYEPGEGGVKLHRSHKQKHQSKCATARHL